MMRRLQFETKLGEWALCIIFLFIWFVNAKQHSFRRNPLLTQECGAQKSLSTSIYNQTCNMTTLLLSKL
jgi:hypothetical protein